MLFGGGSTGRNDHWEWDGASWTQRTPNTLPPPVTEEAMMAFDAARERMVLVCRGSFGLTETWEWDGTDWALRASHQVPNLRSIMFFDEERGAVLLANTWRSPTTTTWEWDGTTWTTLTSTTPLDIGQQRVTYDSARRRGIATQGITAVVEWDGQGWSNPIPTYVQAAATVGLFTWDGQRTLLRVDDPFARTVRQSADLLYTYQPRDPAEVEAIGTGCPGSHGTPDLRVDYGPWVGQNFELSLHRAGSGSADALLMGFCAGQCSGVQFPLDLTAIGMPGCTLDLAPLAAVSGLSGTTDPTRWSIPLCPCPNIVGVDVFCQALTVDPAANQLGLITSNALRTRLGLF